MRAESRIVFRSIFRIKVSDRETGRLIGYVGDISERGLRLLSDEPLETGLPMNWRLRMRAGDGSIMMIDMVGKGLWCKASARSGYFESGVCIDQPGEEFTRLVSSLRARRGAKVPA